MIDIRKLKELVRLMVSSGLTELDLRDSEEQVTLRRHVGGSAHAPGAAPVLLSAGPVAGASAGAATVEAAEPDAGEHADLLDLHRIESPMVGTFYSAGQPDAPPFVTVGSTVAPDTVVCLIEAMKIFNEIKAECAGVVRKVLVKNGDAVEFGQALFLIERA